jgi:hypothetical protein
MVWSDGRSRPVACRSRARRLSRLGRTIRSTRSRQAVVNYELVLSCGVGSLDRVRVNPRAISWAWISYPVSR